MRERITDEQQTPAATAREFRLLFVEDREEDLELIQRELRRGGLAFRGKAVSHLKDFSRCLRESSFDAVLSDFRLPGWTGLDALRELRDRGIETPFLLITGTLGEEKAVECMRLGVTDYILKNHLARLPVAVRQAVEGSESRERQRRIAEELWASESKLGMVLSQLPAIIWTTGRELRVTSLTGAGLAVLPESAWQRGAFSLGEATNLPQPVSSAHGRALEGESVEFESNCESRVYWNRVEPLRDLAGTVTGCLGLALDITEKRSLERQLLQAQKFEAIGQLAGGIAHDFNNVLAAILGMAELGQFEAPEGTRIRERLDKICHHAGRAVALTRQLLAFSRRQQLERRDINLNHSVSEVISLLAESLGRDVEVKAETAPDLPSIHVDPAQIEQVLMNLCINARDAMPQGGRLTIATRSAHCKDEVGRGHLGIPAGDYVCLSVSDTGTGMDAETLGRIFEPFFTTKPPGHGTGLGLATVYGVVKQHGGHIEVHSKVGEGTTFQIYFPTSSPAEPQAASPSSAEKIRGGTETILLAEDHPGLRELVCESLAALGYTVLPASDGQEAVELFRQKIGTVDLLVLDVVMPRLRGPDAYQRIRALDSSIPVLFCTGYNPDSAQVETLSGHPVLQKPYPARELARTVRKLLDQRPQREK